MASVIRVLWGDGRDDCRWNRVWNLGVKPRISEREDCPFMVYCYGKSNADFIQRNGIGVELVNENPFPDGKADYYDGDTWVRPWHYKHKLIKAAIRDHGPVIYCDWDVQIKVRNPDPLFAWLESRPFYLSLYLYQSNRKPDRRSTRMKRLSPSGNWIYCRDHTLPDTVLNMMELGEGRVSWHDEYAMNEMIDRIHNGWCGENYWLKNYESPFMVQKNVRCPWKMKLRDGMKITRYTPVPFVWEKCFYQ